jgi:hypothetical protein
MKKPKQANWGNYEIVAFINAKKVEHNSKLDFLIHRTTWKHQ